MAVKLMDVKFNSSEGRRKDFDFVSVILILLALGIIFGAVYFIFYFQEGKLKELVDSGKTITAIMVENNHRETQAVILSFYNPKTEKLAFIFIPGTTRLKVDYEDKPSYDIIKNIYFRGGLKVLRSTIENLTENSFDYYLVYDVRKVEQLVDLLEGINVELSEPISYVDDAGKLIVRIPAGKVKLDGAKVRELLLYIKNPYEMEEMILNHRVVLESILNRSDDLNNILENKRVYSVLVKGVETNFTRKDVPVVLDIMRNLTPSKILTYRMFGKAIIINEEKYITPVENGRWLRERIREVKNFLKNEGPVPIGDRIKIEVLNGSENPGQAQSLRNYLIKYGFDVVHFGNAMRSDYKKTIVIDRIGRPSLAKRIAEIINCQEVYSRIDKSLMVDVTIIIGADFEGTSVR